MTLLARIPGGAMQDLPINRHRARGLLPIVRQLTVSPLPDHPTALVPRTAS